MTNDEWLCAYLLRFGTETISSADVQEGEREFLMEMGRAIRANGSPQNAWWVITDAYRRRKAAGGNPVD